MPVSPDIRSFWTSNTIFQDHAGEWWLLTTENVQHFAAAPNLIALAQEHPLATYGIRDGLKSNQVFHIFEDTRGAIWVSTFGIQAAEAGLSRWDRATQTFHTFSAAESVPLGKSVCSFAEDSHGNLWFGFYEGGLARFVAGSFKEFKTSDGLPDGLITALHVDQKGRLWLASALGGLGRIDDPSADNIRF